MSCYWKFRDKILPTQMCLFSIVWMQTFLLDCCINIISDDRSIIDQGLLKIWTEHSHWFSVNLKPLKISWPKFQHCYNYKRNEFSQNLEVVAQKIRLLRPFEVLNVFGGKSISLAPRAFIFGEKRVSIEMHKWWNFGVDISNHFPAIQNWPFCLSNSNPHDV